MGVRGFTLIELLVVICILSILIALSIAGTVVVIDHSHRNDTEQFLHHLSAAVTAYSLKFGDYPPPRSPTSGDDRRMT